MTMVLGRGPKLCKIPSIHRKGSLYPYTLNPKPRTQARLAGPVWDFLFGGT